MSERSWWAGHSGRLMIAVAAVAFALYAGTLGYGLVWDDPDLMATVARASQRGGIAGVLSTEFILKPDRPTGYYRPVPLLSLWIDARLAPAIPSIFHLTNVILHVANTALVFAVLRLILATSAAAAVGALVFAAHPVHTESVAFVSGRTDLWATLFVLIAVLAWLRGRGCGGRARAGWLLLGATAFLLASLSKEAAFAMPAVLLVGDAVLEGRGFGRGWMARNGPWLAAWACVLAVVLLLRMGVAHVGLLPRTAAAAAASGHGSSAAAAVGIFLQYLRLLTIPWPLSALYVPSSFEITAVSLLGAALFVALCAAGDAGAPLKAGTWGFCWALLFLLPASGVVTIAAASMAERFLYLPSFGVALAFGHVLERGVRRFGVWLWLPAAAAVAMMGVGTVARSAVWRDEMALYEDMVRTSPRAAVVHFNLGNAYLQAGRFEDAAAAYRKAIDLKPDHAGAHINLGICYRKLGRLEQAAASYGAAVRVDPSLPQAFLNLANVQANLGRLREAADNYGRALALKPDYLDARYSLALVHAARGDLGAARREADAVGKMDAKRGEALLDKLGMR